MSCWLSSPGATSICRSPALRLSIFTFSLVVRASIVLSMPLLERGLWMVFLCPLVYDPYFLQLDSWARQLKQFP